MGLVSSENFPIFTLLEIMLLSGGGLGEVDGAFGAAKFLATTALVTLPGTLVFLFDGSEAECSFSDRSDCLRVIFKFTF